MAALNALGGIYQSSEFTGFRDDLNSWVEKDFRQRLYRYEPSAQHTEMTHPGAQPAAIFPTSAFPHMFIQARLAVHFRNKLNGSAHESEGHATGEIVTQSIAFKPFLLV